MKQFFQKLKNAEWSKKFSATIAMGFGGYSIWCGIRYYELCEIALQSGAIVMPDVTLAVVCVSTVVASLVSYLLYQAGLKNSRNKYGISSDGQPFEQKLEDPNAVAADVIITDSDNQIMG